MEKTYWESNGKYQAWYDNFSKCLPGFGQTNNDYANLVINIGSLYYDVYNNGGCNIKDGVKDDRITQVKKHIVISKERLYKCDYVYLENKINEAFELVMTKTSDELKFDIFTVYQWFEKEKVSRRKVNEHFQAVTFGESSECEKWYKHRIENKNWAFKEIK